MLEEQQQGARWGLNGHADASPLSCLSHVVSQGCTDNYCLLHATDSTRVLFPRPVIAAGATAFTSDQAPARADGFALMGATGVFPRQDTCLAFPSAAYSLQIDGAGAFTLTGLPASFPPSIGQRTLATGSAGAIGFEYGDGNGTASNISVAITPSAWSFTLEPVNVVGR